MSDGRFGRALALAAFALASYALPLPAQDSAEVLAPVPAIVRGRVIMPAGTKETPVPGVMVTLHRVGPDRAGPVDSVRTGADGRYAIRYTRGGNAQAVYFAAVLYRGIAYFSSPLRALVTPEADGEIVVFDTTTHAVPFTVQGHHIVVAAPGPDGTRTMLEVYEVSNDSSVTVVGADSVSAVWSAPLPHGATNFQGGQGDVAPAALAARGDRAVMLAPFGPGIKQLSFSYSLAPGAFPLKLTAERPVVVQEVLLEEEAAQARAATLRAQGTTQTQGRTFKRFLAQGTPAGETLRIDVPLVAASTRTRVLIGLAIVIGLAMLGSLGRALARRGGTPRAAKAAATMRTEVLIAEIAALDARREAGEVTLSADAYAEQRATLKRELASALEEAGPRE
jgi:hypothetical protein